MKQEKNESMSKLNHKRLGAALRKINGQAKYISYINCLAYDIPGEDTHTTVRVNRYFRYVEDAIDFINFVIPKNISKLSDSILIGTVKK